MDNTPTDARTALQRAGDIPTPSPKIINRLAQIFAGQHPIRVIPKTVTRSAAATIDPSDFQDTEEGSGAFGRWNLDAAILPCYRYDMNQRRDVRAYYVNTEGQDRREHWHQVGNDCVTALASNDGTVQVYLANRGGIFLNRSLTGTGDPPSTVIGYIDALLRLVIRWSGALRDWWIRFRCRKVIMPRVAALNVAPPQEVDRHGAEQEYAFAGGFGYLDDGQET